jgi:hypothetical protein
MNNQFICLMSESHCYIVIDITINEEHKQMNSNLFSYQSLASVNFLLNVQEMHDFKNYKLLAKEHLL